MKKLLLLASFICFGSSFAQSKNKAVANQVLAKKDNITAELVKGRLIVFAEVDGKKDSLFSKRYDPNNPPTDVKISPYTTKGTQLCAISWCQKDITQTKLKTETATLLNTEIWDVSGRTCALSNCQKTVNIKEIHYLDALQGASETIERIRREGFEFVLNPDGDVVLKNKNRADKLTYDATGKKYVFSTVQKK